MVRLPIKPGVKKSTRGWAKVWASTKPPFDFPANFDFWSKVELWNTHECVALLMGKEPDLLTLDKLADLSESDTATRYIKLLHLVSLGQRTGSLPTQVGFVNPIDLLAWARLRGIVVPELLDSGTSALTGTKSTELESDPIRRTGDPGRPNSRHLYEEEFRRRCVAGDLCESVTLEAKHLADWLLQQHPEAPRCGWVAIKNRICADFRRAKAPKIIDKTEF